MQFLLDTGNLDEIRAGQSWGKAARIFRREGIRTNITLLFKHPLTEIGQTRFLADWRALQAELERKKTKE
jgi:hypothetical protein